MNETPYTSISATAKIVVDKNKLIDTAKPGCLETRPMVVSIPKIDLSPVKSLKRIDRDDKSIYTEYPPGEWSHALREKLSVQLLTDNWLTTYELFQRLNLEDSSVLFVNDNGSGISAGNHYMNTVAVKSNYEWYSLTANPLKETIPDSFIQLEDRKYNVVICSITNSVSQELYALHLACEMLTYGGGLVIKLHHKIRFWTCTILRQLFDTVEIFLPVAGGPEYYLIARGIVVDERAKWKSRLTDYENETTSVTQDEKVVAAVNQLVENEAVTCDVVSAKYWLTRYTVEPLTVKDMLSLPETDVESQFLMELQVPEELGEITPTDIDVRVLEELQTTLNGTKSKLDGISAEKYKEYQNKTNYIKKWEMKLIREYAAQITTNAWFKMWEILGRFELLHSGTSVLFGAELPGAFISCVNHYAALRKYKWSWLANSLVGTDTSLDDKYGLIKTYPDRWLMDDEINGDLTSPKVVVALRKKVRVVYPDGVDLYVCDIGIKITDWNREEEELEKPQLGQALLGLSCLKKGGSYVVKLFTVFRPFSVSLLYVVTNCFNKASVFKPYTSRSRNSECYLVCEGFNGMSKDISTGLLARLKKFSSDGLVEVPDEWIRGLARICRELFVDRQVAAINRVVEEITTGKTKEIDTEKAFVKWNKLTGETLGELPKTKSLKTK